MADRFRVTLAQLNPTVGDLSKAILEVHLLNFNGDLYRRNIRVLFRKGQLGASGSVAWDFDHCGMIEAAPASADADAELAAIEAGAHALIYVLELALSGRV